MSNFRAKSGSVALSTRTIGDPSHPPIILIQGLGMCMADWPAVLISALERKFHVILFDNRDAGSSDRCTDPYTLFDMAGDVEAVAAHFGLARFGLLGFSMGGMIAQIVAARRPEQVTSFIQICSSAGEAIPPFSAETKMRFATTSKGFGCRAQTLDWLAEDIMHFARPFIINPSEAVAKAQDMLDAGHSADAFARQYQAICASGNRSDLLQCIHSPALIVSGAEDCCIPAASSRCAADLITNATLRNINGCGHMITDDTIALVNDWLTTTHQQHAHVAI